MKTEIIIISGFLGAGKTTLIQKLLGEAFTGSRVALIENDFGEISVDAALLRKGGFEVREINSGCICCSLSGDFVKALREVLERFQPDKVIIEPSGVGKLSDIVKACTEERLAPLCCLGAKITVADVKRCAMYLANFGEFFEDQIKNADTVILSRTDRFPDRVSTARALVAGINPCAAVIDGPWESVAAADILCPGRRGEIPVGGCSCGHDHRVCSDEHEHGAGHSHTHEAEEEFDTVTIRTDKVFTERELREKVREMEQSSSGSVLRAKGTVRRESGCLEVQYVPGELKLKCVTSSGGGVLCIIGRGLDKRKLTSLFTGG